ncbi:hypothetical protein OHB49_08180 [Streptomyces sp. NBC_01717]|uniref:hypothetical protein n=1 Tax=Streptomyces sp. NBC_01717 TaxID=2975918 RepID=UPI002E31EB6C|nr:hypothetical protein [Streptomyces sp. NBC_01717]
MQTTTDDICARDGCRFHVEHVLIDNRLYPTTMCGDACRDFAWALEALRAAPDSPEKAEALADMSMYARILSERTEPMDIGALFGGDDG